MTKEIDKGEFLERLSLLSEDGKVYQKKIGFTVKEKQNSQKGYGEIISINKEQFKFFFEGELRSISLYNKDFECRILNTNIIHLFAVKIGKLEIQFTII